MALDCCFPHYVINNKITALKTLKLSMTPLFAVTQMTTVASVLQSNVICFVAYPSLLPSTLSAVWQLGSVPATFGCGGTFPSHSSHKDR